MNVASAKPGRCPPGREEGVVCAPIVDHYLRICEQQGIPRQRMLAAAGLGEQDINPPGSWVRQQVIERLFRGRLQEWPDPLLGLHFAAAMEPARAGVLGYLALSCPSILDLHRTLHEFGRLVSDIFTASLVQEPGQVLWCIDFRYTDPEVNRHSTEWVLAAFAALVLRLDPAALREVRLRHAPCLLGDQPHPDYTRAFPCPLRFGASRSALVLDPQGVSRPSPNGDPLVHAMLCQQARLLLAQLGPPGKDLAERVRREIRQLLAEGRVSREAVCERIGISSRHLHRQLQQLGCSYQGLLDELRLELARRQVRSAGPDLERLAAGLGFASAKSFARWFAQKQGATPAAYRRHPDEPAAGGFRPA